MAPQHTDTIKNIKVAFFLNLGFTLLELVGGVLTNSTAILADAVHDLGDSVALGQAWYFERLAQQRGDARYTYGFKRFSLLGALISTLLLLSGALYVLSEAVPRIINPEPSNAQGMALLALIGVAVNGYCVLRLTKGSGINARTAGLHLLEDTLGWAAVLVVAIILQFKEVYILDPILAVLITLYILSNVIKNIRKIVPIFLQAAPEEFDVEAVASRIEDIQHVRSVHHIHLWSLDSDHVIFSAHLVLDYRPTPEQYLEIKEKVKRLIEEYGFQHSTVEIEFPLEECRIESGNHCRK